MAFLRPVQLVVLIVLSAYLISFKARGQQINLGTTLSLVANITSWLSPSGIFAFGFYPQQGISGSFAVGIWMPNGSETTKTIVWTANRDDPPLSSDASLSLKPQGLVLQTSQNTKLLSNFSTSSPRLAGSAAMLDSGNFVVYGENQSEVIWESFVFPTDTILGNQTLACGNQLVSSSSSTNQSSGRFSLDMQQDGNLVLYPAMSSRTRYEDAYWSSGTPQGMFSELCLDRTGALFLKDQVYLEKIYILANGSDHDKGKIKNNETVIYRATLDVDGIFRLYSHWYANSLNNEARIHLEWSALENQRGVAKGSCGLNSYYAVGYGKDADDCYCYPGFAFIDPGNKLQGCYRNFVEDSCREDEDQGLRYNMTHLENMLWGDESYSIVAQLEKEVCSRSCLEDCNCWAVLYTSSNCSKFRFPLRYGRRSPDISHTAFFKMILASNINIHIPPVDNIPTLILGLSFGSVAGLSFVFAVSIFIIYKHRDYRYKRLMENANLVLDEDFSTLQSFSYDELEKATDNFREELGRGYFGAVYKGNLSGTGSHNNKVIAVKRLENVVEEGVRNFRAEMSTITKTHHRNLVQLLGFCIEGSKKLLVYEYMSKGSLADLLFKADSRPSWKERVRFILDVARGVLYLHEECGVHIIHCNLKPQNILLDDTWTAKISDFGFATLLKPNPADMPMRVEGSAQYFAPELQQNALVSVKTDIYSFGVVLFETLCCRRNLKLDNVSTPDEIILSNWVYNCFIAGELNRLVYGDEDVDIRTLERMVKVGLWCIQDDPALRPLMKNVILMLEGTMDITIPPPTELPLNRS